jgi:hypothetical protein
MSAHRFPKLIRDASIHDQARYASAEYLKLEVRNWELKFRYVINCIKVAIHALDFVDIFEVEQQALFFRSVHAALVLINEDHVFKRKTSSEINDKTASEDGARASTFQAIAQAARGQLAELVLHGNSTRNIFNRNVASFLNEAND